MIPLFNRQRWILLLGDVVLILLATHLSPWIRLGRYLHVLEIHTVASIFTLVMYLIMLYIFDLYNIGRNFRSRGTLLRTAAALIVAGFFSAFMFYSIPQWKYGRGIFLLQMALVLFFVGGWRWFFSLIFPVTLEREDILILGAGRSGTTLRRLLENPLSPYRVAGFLDNDPAKLGKAVGSPRVLGTTDQLLEIAAKKGVRTVILVMGDVATKLHYFVRLMHPLRRAY